MEDSDRVEKFYCNERFMAYVFSAYLRRIQEDRGFDDDLRIERLQDCLISVDSPTLSKFVNDFYDYELSSSSFALTDQGKKRMGHANFSYDDIKHAPRRLKLAFLAGAHYRYGTVDGFKFSNSSGKIKLLRQLLADVGCEETQIESKATIPAQNTVLFQFTDEFRTWTDWLPDTLALAMADSLMGMANAEELEIYRAVIEAARENVFGGCNLGVRFELNRSTTMRLDGDQRIPGLTGPRKEALADFNSIRADMKSLREINAPNVRIVWDRRNWRVDCLASLSRVGFDASRTTAVTFFNYFCDAPEFCREEVAVFLKYDDGEWYLTGFAARN
jgi:hypothetical protein